MMAGDRSILVIACAVACLTLTACKPQDPVASATPQGSPEVQAEPAPAPTGGARPVDPREAHERAELMEAVEGLDFDDGLVAVTDPIVADTPDAAETRAAAARELRDLNKTSEALRAFAEAVRTAPDRAPLYNDLGQALRARGETEMATAAFRTAVSLDATLIEPRFNLAFSLWRSLERDAAIEQMQALLELDPTHGRAHERLAVWQYYAEDYDAAWRHVKAARDVGQAVPPQFLNLLESRMADPG